MRNFCAAIAAASLVATSAFAATAVNAPLPSGHPAGLKVAQEGGDTFLFLVGGAAIIAGIVIIASNNSNSKTNTGLPVTTPSTT